MKKTILLVLIAFAILLSGCTQPAKTTNTVTPSSEIKNCGTSSTLVNADFQTVSPEDLEKDSALVCMGKNIIEGCKKTKAIINSTDDSKGVFELKGKQGNNCIVRVGYGSASGITSEESKKFAESYAECPIDITTLLEEIGAAEENPGSLAMSVYVIGLFSIIDTDTNCTGPLVQLAQETLNVQ